MKQLPIVSFKQSSIHHCHKHCLHCLPTYAVNISAVRFTTQTTSTERKGGQLCRICWSLLAVVVRRRSVAGLRQTTSCDCSPCHQPTSHQRKLTDWVQILHPTQHKTGHFIDVLPSQSLGAVVKKLNVTQQKHTIQQQNRHSKNRKTQRMLNVNKCTKTKTKPTLNFKNCSCVCVCVCIIVHNCRTQHSTKQFW